MNFDNFARAQINYDRQTPEDYMFSGEYDEEEVVESGGLKDANEMLECATFREFVRAHNPERVSKWEAWKREMDLKAALEKAKHEDLWARVAAKRGLL